MAATAMRFSTMINISADLLRAVSAKTNTDRKQILSNCLQHTGELDESSTAAWKRLFELYYTPDLGEIKYYTEYISRVYIDYHPTPQYRHTICFHLELISGEKDVAGKRYLAGEGRNERINGGRALRYAIDDQIVEWRKLHPLNPADMCPVAHIPLDSDAQVDHVPPFHILVKQWLQITPGVTWHSSKMKKSVYELDEPYKTSWQAYHRVHATLRYLSVEGNKIAHKGWGC